MQVKTWILLLVCLFSAHVNAFKNLDINLDRGATNLAPHFEYNVGQYDPLEAPPIEGWSTFQRDHIKLGFTDRVQWFRTQISNKNAHPVSLFLEIDNPLLDNVTLYVLKDGKVRTVQNLGDNYAFSLRPVLHESFVIPISFLTDETLEIYLSVQSAGSLTFNAKLWQKEAFQQQQNYKRLLTGVFIGIIIAAIFAYLVVFVLGREKVALLDSSLLLSLLMIVLTMNGVAFHYFWPEFPAMQQHSFYVFSCVAIFCSALLAKHHIAHLSDNKKLNQAFNITATLAIVLLPLTLYLSYQWGIYLITFAAMVICLFHIYSGLWVYKRGEEEEQDLNVSVAILLVAIVSVQAG